MADYRLRMMLPAQRSKGRSAVAMAAYRSAERLTDERLGNVHDYERRSGVTFSEIVTPEHLPQPTWADDRGAFWNRVEASETRKNSQVAREIQLSLPHELSAEGRQEITLDFAQHVADRYGIGVDVNIHAPSAEGDQRNHHAHLMLTTRQMDMENETGFGAKVRTLDGISERQAKREGDEIEHLREFWREIQNLALEREDVRDGRGELVQVDHRSYERQGVDREGTEHEGHVATAIKRRGGESDVVSANDNIRERNAEKDQLVQQIEKSRGAIAEELQAVHRTPEEDKIKFKFHDDETVQEILAEQDAARRGFTTLGRGSLSLRVFTPGDSRRLAAFNAGLAGETGERQDEGQGGGPSEVDGEDQRTLWREAQRAVDQEEEDRAWASYQSRYEISGDAQERMKWREAQQEVDQEEVDREWDDYARHTGEENAGGEENSGEEERETGAGQRVTRLGLSRTRHTPAEVEAFNKGLAMSEKSLSSDDSQEQGRENTAPQPERLDTDPQLEVEASSKAQAMQARRWHGLDALSREEAEPVEETREKERDGDSDWQFANSNELLDTDPVPEEYEQQRSGPSYRR